MKDVPVSLNSKVYERRTFSFPNTQSGLPPAAMSVREEFHFKIFHVDCFEMALTNSIGNAADNVLRSITFGDSLTSLLPDSRLKWNIQKGFQPSSQANSPNAHDWDSGLWCVRKGTAIAGCTSGSS